jgi:tetrahydromethanopterin S-methyltransferase subunit G
MYTCYFEGEETAHSVWASNKEISRYLGLTVGIDISVLYLIVI